MPVTMKQVLNTIDKDEPDYEAAARLGPEALPHLQMIIEADDPLRAAKAAYAATLIGGTDSKGVLQKAAEHHDPQVRIAVAHGLRHSADPARVQVLRALLGDADAGVRKVTLASAGPLAETDLREKISAMAEKDPEEYLRTAAKTAMHKPK
ncbi:MAG: HEAT repeat domain-containing protein [Acidobacteriota bacterium]